MLFWKKTKVEYCCEDLRKFLRGRKIPESWSLCPYCGKSYKRYCLPDVPEVPDLIEYIEKIIRDSVSERGMVKRWPPNRLKIGPTSDHISKRLLDASEALAYSLGHDGKGDPNLTYMHMQALISYAWINFIFYAKGLAVERYGEKNCSIMMQIVESFPEQFRRVREEAIEYAKEYPLDNPNWDKCMEELVKSTYIVRHKTGDDLLNSMKKKCCEKPFYKEHCYPPFIGFKCENCGRTEGVHYTWKGKNLPELSTIGEFNNWINENFNTVEGTPLNG